MQMQTFKPLFAAAITLACLCSVGAQAEGVYAGASLGAPHFQDSVNGVTGDGSGLSGKLFAGYQFSPYFALEAGVADLGHIDNASGRVNSHAEYLDAVATAPLSDKWSLLGRMGLAHASLNTSNGDGRGNGLKLGLGAQYALTSNVALRSEVERYRADAFGAKPNVDQYTVGLKVAF